MAIHMAVLCVQAFKLVYINIHVGHIHPVLSLVYIYIYIYIWVLYICFQPLFGCHFLCVI